MNAMQITPDMIRRFPFAVNPNRITADLEQTIATDMVARSKAEGNHPGRPPGAYKDAPHTKKRVRYGHEAIAQSVLEIVSDGKLHSRHDLCARHNVSVTTLCRIMAPFVKSGAIIKNPGRGGDQTTYEQAKP